MTIYGARGLTGRGQARELLSLAVKEQWGLSPLPEISRLPGGKPFFPGFADLHFNLSHSGDLALCALDHEAVGVDIQLTKVWRPSLPKRVCSREELVWLEKQPDLWSAFTLLWALKECRVKESGQGLTTAIRNIRVPLPDACPCTLEELRFRTYPGAGWAAAACGQGTPPETILWRMLH